MKRALKILFISVLFVGLLVLIGTKAFGQRPHVFLPGSFLVSAGANAICEDHEGKLSGCVLSGLADPRSPSFYGQSGMVSCVEFWRGERLMVNCELANYQTFRAQTWEFPVAFRRAPNVEYNGPCRMLPAPIVTRRSITLRPNPGARTTTCVLVLD